MKFIVADDDPVVRHILSMILAESGEIILLDNGKECLSYFEEDTADFLFLDIQLPDVTGPEVLVDLRKLPNGKTVTVVAVSANPLEEMRELFGAVQPDRYLEKPFTADKVLEIIV